MLGLSEHIYSANPKSKVQGTSWKGRGDKKRASRPVSLLCDYVFHVTGKSLSMNSQRHGGLNKKQIMTTSVDMSMWMGKLYGLSLVDEEP